MKPISFFLFIISFFIFLLSCKRTTGPKFPVADLQLTVQDVSCTEAWLSLKTEIAEKTENDSSGLELKLFRDDSLIVSRPFTSADTILYIDGLQPATSYSFSAKVSKKGKLQATSNQLPVTTMDTTSHDFTWQTWEFGGQNGSSYFQDVAIIDKNCAWAVGEIHTKDTDQWNADSTKWIQPYNAAQWDGEKWELKKIKTAACGGVVYPTLETVFSFGKNDIVFSEGAMIIHFDGDTFKSDCSLIPKLTGGVRKIWGTSNKDYYVVGTNGLIAHYDGREWTRIKSGTETQIRDIWGYTDKITGEKKILCAVSNVTTYGDYKILRINDDNTVTEVSWNTGDIDKRVNSIWFNNRQIFTCGGGVFKSKANGLWEKQSLPPIHTNRIRGIEINDVFVGGDFGLLAHFNGINWKVYPEANVALFYSLSYKCKILTAVGERNGKAVILIMRKQ